MHMQAHETAYPVEGFIIHERIGRGGAAGVYRATQKALNREVAFKAVTLSERTEDFYSRFVREAQMIAALEHPSIVPIYSFGIYEGEIAYFAMRLMRGGSLGDLMHGGALSPNAVVEITTQVGHALGYAHSQGILHRDLKPSNILLDEHGNAFLADFGLAKLLNTETQPPEQISGSAAYISPEQLEGHPASIQSDIYSLGMLVYHLLVGHPAFEGSAMTVCYKHVHEPPVPPHEANPGIPLALSQSILRALEKNPTARYPSAEAFVETINTAAGRKYGTNSFRLIAPRSTTPRISGRRWLLLPITLLVIVVVAALPRTQRVVQRIEAGQRGDLADLTLTQHEIDAARAAVGDGFIAYLVCDYKVLNQLRRAGEIAAMASENDIDFQAYDSQNTASLQPALIEQARGEGARAFILCPVTTHSLDEPLVALERDGVPVIFPTLIDYRYGLKMASDYEAAGRTMAQFAGQIANAEHGGQGNAFVLTFPGTPTEVLFNRGVETGLRETAPGVNLIGYGSGFQLQDSQAAVQQVLDSGQPISLIIAITDRAAFGAIAALEAAGIPPDSVAIVSASGDIRAQEYIREGRYIRGTLMVNRAQGSTVLFNGLVKLLAGSSVPEVLYTTPGEMLTRDSLNNTDSPPVTDSTSQ